MENVTMEDFGFLEMQEKQKRLQEQYKNRWESIGPEAGKHKLLWLMIELGEVADVIKKEGEHRIMSDRDVRTHLIEEMCDVLMYYNDVMLCYGISVDELRQQYRLKYQRNMERWER